MPFGLLRTKFHFQFPSLLHVDVGKRVAFCGSVAFLKQKNLSFRSPKIDLFGKQHQELKLGFLCFCVDRKKKCKKNFSKLHSSEGKPEASSKSLTERFPLF